MDQLSIKEARNCDLRRRRRWIRGLGRSVRAVLVVLDIVSVRVGFAWAKNVIFRTEILHFCNYDADLACA